MKRILFLTLLSVLALTGFAQDEESQYYIKVASFRALTTDMDARIQAPVMDQNGNKCALIKVLSTVKGLTFESPATGIVRQREMQNLNEVWVYVPAGSRYVSIFHSKALPIRNYQYPEKIESAMVYEMVINSNIPEDQAAPVNIDEDVITNNNVFGTVNFTVQPAEAQVVLRKVPEQTDVQGRLSKQMPLGRFHYRVTAENFFDEEGTFELTEDTNTVAVNVTLKNHIGALDITSKPAGAKVFLDGKEIGITPIAEYQTTAGKHSVQLRMNGYGTSTRDVNVFLSRTANVAVTLVDSATYTINTLPKGSQVWVNGKELGKAPCSFVGSTAEYDIRAKHYKYSDYHKKLQLKASEPDVTLKLARNYQPKNSVYLQLGGQVGSCLALTGTIGGYIHNVNVEVSYLATGVEDDTKLYGLYPPEVNKLPETWYCRSYIGVGSKVGYGFSLTPRLRVTPQIGATFLNLEGTTDDYYVSKTEGETVHYNYGEVNGYAVSATVGARLDYALLSHFGLYLAPEYDVAVTKSDTFKKVSDISSKINGWLNGFNCRLGLYIFF